MALATKTAPQARVGAPIYQHDVVGGHTAIGIRLTGTLPLDAGETIDMLKVPKGARVLDAGIICSAIAATTDADLGLYDTYDQSTYHADADGLIDAADLNTAILNKSGQNKTTEIQLGVKLDWDCYVRLTINTTNLTDAITVVVWVYYVVGTD